MKKYRVWAKCISYCWLDVEANSEDEAMEMAEEADGGEYEESPHGDWIIVECEPLEADAEATCGNCSDWKCRCSDCPELEEESGKWVCGGNGTPCEKVEFCGGWENACPLWK